MTFEQWWRGLNIRDLPNVQRYKVVCKMAYTAGQNEILSRRSDVAFQQKQPAPQEGSGK